MLGWSANQPHKPPLERGHDSSKVMAPLEHETMLANERERPLLQPKLGAFFYAHFRLLGVAPEGREDSNFGMMAKRIIAPMPGRHHSPIKVHDPHQLQAIKAGNRAPVPWVRERRDNAQALFALVRRSVGRFERSSLRRSSISRSSSARRTRIGSQSSPQGVP